MSTWLTMTPPVLTNTGTANVAIGWTGAKGLSCRLPKSTSPTPGVRLGNTLVVFEVPPSPITEAVIVIGQGEC